VSDGKFYPQPNWMRRISEIGCGLWPTATANNFEIADVDALLARRQRMKEKHGNGNGFGLTLGQAVKMWPTPKAKDHKRNDSPSERNRSSPALSAVVQMWPTPTARDWRSGHASDATHDRNSRPLSEVVVKAEKQQMWRTPSASVIEPKSNVVKLTGRTPQDPQVGLADQVGGQLSPDWVEWLMNWPIGWTSLEPLPQATVDAWLAETVSGEWWQHEHDLPRIVKGVPNRTHRLKAIGNGQVSAVVTKAWQILTEDLSNAN
jgi:hypothetical protein